MKIINGPDASKLSRFPHRTHPLWWGIMGLVIIEAMMVATLIASYFYLRVGAAHWPPPGLEAPPLLWPSVNVVLLLASSVTMWWAGQGINRGNNAVLIAGTGLSVLLALIVLVLRSLEFQALAFSWDSHSYGAIVWTLMGFHNTHVASAALGTAVVTVLAMCRYFTPERQLGVVVDTLYWYFVAGAWLPIYFVLYWSPRLLPVSS